MAHVEADFSVLISSVVAAFRNTSNELHAIARNAGSDASAGPDASKKQQLLDELQHSAQHIERTSSSGYLNLGAAYGVGHENTKFELARLADAIRIQILGPLTLANQTQSRQYDTAQTLDIILAYKQVALDIVEQLRQPPAPQVSSVFGQSIDALQTEPPRKRRGRIDSVQQDAAATVIVPVPESQQAQEADFSVISPRRTISRATTISLSADSNNGSSRRPSAVSSATTTSTCNTIASLSARMNSQSNHPMLPSKTAPRRANVPEPVVVPNVALAASIGSVLHASMTTPTPGPPRPAAVKRNNSAYGNSSGALLAGMFLPPDLSLHTTQSHTAHDDPHTPSKANHWHGFCRGAWIARQDPRRVFTTHIVPVGMYGRKEQWRCKDCHFTGNVTGAGKHRTFDNRVYVDADTSIQFKWMFLAKSHVKVREKAMEHAPTFGCTECVDEGEPMVVYPDAHALLGHIADAHPDGVKAAVRPPDPFWQGALVTHEGDWDLYMPQYPDATTPLSPPLTWH